MEKFLPNNRQRLFFFLFSTSIKIDYCTRGFPRLLPKTRVAESGPQRRELKADNMFLLDNLARSSHKSGITPAWYKARIVRGGSLSHPETADDEWINRTTRRPDRVVFFYLDATPVRLAVDSISFQLDYKP